MKVSATRATSKSSASGSIPVDASSTVSSATTAPTITPNAVPPPPKLPSGREQMLARLKEIVPSQKYTEANAQARFNIGGILIGVFSLRWLRAVHHDYFSMYRLYTRMLIPYHGFHRSWNLDIKTSIIGNTTPTGNCQLATVSTMSAIIQYSQDVLALIAVLGSYQKISGKRLMLIDITANDWEKLKALLDPAFFHTVFPPYTSTNGSSMRLVLLDMELIRAVYSGWSAAALKDYDEEILNQAKALHPVTNPYYDSIKDDATYESFIDTLVKKTPYSVV